MKVVIRVDASLQIGTGHVMRCLTLAKTLKGQDAEVVFICREHQGNLIKRIQDEGFTIYPLPLLNRLDQIENKANSSSLFHADWLGCAQQQDAEQCSPIIESIKPDWLIVDHYALDQTWHALLKTTYKKLMVIDDLADRQHLCNLLLDQTYGRKPVDYQHLVPEKCQMLLGSQYALLRSEFAEWRDYSLKRRIQPEFKKLLITMGGVDSDNVTCQVLEAIRHVQFPQDIEITVVMGGTAPHLNEVKTQANTMPHKTQVMVNVNNMAERMANADLAIGAAGATTWERCCLGLPTIQMVIADNQVFSAKKLSEDGVIKCLPNISSLDAQTFDIDFKKIIKVSSLICEGLGSNKVVGVMNE